MKLRVAVVLAVPAFVVLAGSVLWGNAQAATLALSADDLQIQVGQQKAPCPKCGGNTQMVCSGCAEAEIKCAMGLRKYKVTAKGPLGHFEASEEWEVPDGCAIRSDSTKPANTWTDPCPPKNWQNERGQGNSSPAPQGTPPLNCGTHEVHGCTEGAEKETKLTLGEKLKGIFSAAWHIIHTKPCDKGNVVDEPDCRPGTTKTVLVNCQGQLPAR